MKYHITGRGRGQKQPPGPDRVGLTGGGGRGGGGGESNRGSHRPDD